MNSREKILSGISNLNLAPAELPTVPEFETAPDLEKAFTKALEASHAEVISCSNKNDMAQIIRPLVSTYSKVASLLPDLYAPSVSLDSIERPGQLHSVEAAIIEAAFGIAENGAVWVSETQAGVRVLPFIVWHLVVIVNRHTLVGNMHQAYRQIEEVPGFGVFIAGPSKTADIEQSLVIGAHGPKKMTVLIG